MGVVLGDDVRFCHRSGSVNSTHTNGTHVIIQYRCARNNHHFISLKISIVKISETYTHIHTYVYTHIHLILQTHMHTLQVQYYH